MVSDLWVMVGAPAWVHHSVYQNADRCGLRGTTKAGGLIFELAVPPWLTTWEWGFLPPIMEVADAPLLVRVVTFRVDYGRRELLYARCR